MTGVLRRHIGFHMEETMTVPSVSQAFSLEEKVPKAVSSTDKGESRSRIWRAGCRTWWRIPARTWIAQGLGRCVAIAGLGLATLACTQQPRQSGAVQEQASPEIKVPTFWRNAKIRISFAGSAANFTLITRTLGEGIHRRLGPGSMWVVYGARDLAIYEGPIALGEGEVDFAMTTPPVTARMAMEGKGYFKKAYPNLRSVAVYPQNDWVSCALLSKFGINSFEDMKTQKPPLRIATGPLNSNNGVGFYTEQLLRAYGITPQDVESWGGKFLPAMRAGDAVQLVLNGEADLACHEAWSSFRSLTDKMPVKFLPVSDGVLNQLHEEFGYGRNVIRKGT